MAPRALAHCWAHLVGVLGGVKLYSGYIIIVKIYPALSTAVGGWDRMDCRRPLWMTLFIYRTHHQSQCLGIDLIIGDIG